jgi:5-deoxy-D-glucuronate isomerase
VALVNVIPDLGGSFEYLIRAGPRARIGMARGRGSATGSTGPAFAWIAVEGGDGEIAAGTLHVDVGGRDDVFDGPGWSVLVGPKTPFAIRGNIRYAIAGRSWTGEVATRAVSPGDVDESRGHDGRVVRTYVADGPLVCGETMHEPGGWASWPPHTLEREAVFLYRLSDPDGFAIQVLDNKDGGRRAEIVTDGEVRRVRSGDHPVVASPAGSAVTMWVLAGTSEPRPSEPDRRFR